MGTAADTCFRIVLGKSEDALHATVAATVATIFGISESLALKVTQAAPISILTRLSLAQGSSLLQTLQPLREAGAGLSLETGGDRLTNQVSWPSPPKLFGTLASDLGGHSATVCPSCGAGLVVQLSPIPTGGAVSAPAPVAAKPTTAVKSSTSSSIDERAASSRPNPRKTSVRKVVRKSSTAAARPVAPATVKPTPTPPSAPEPEPEPVEDEDEGNDSLFGGLEPLSDSGPVSWAESPSELNTDDDE